MTHHTELYNMWHMAQTVIATYGLFFIFFHAIWRYQLRTIGHPFDQYLGDSR